MKRRTAIGAALIAAPAALLDLTAVPASAAAPSLGSPSVPRSPPTAVRR
jgi:hypothetical protein